jgi:hypothetical protein
VYLASGGEGESLDDFDVTLRDLCGNTERLEETGLRRLHTGETGLEEHVDWGTRACSTRYQNIYTGTNNVCSYKYKCTIESM